MKYTGFFLLLVLLNGCKPGNEHELKTVDSLLTAVEHQQKIYKEKTSISFEHIINDVNSDIKYISDSLKDSLTAPEADLCNNYNRVAASLSTLQSKLPEVGQDLELGKTQLKDLQTDIKNNAVKSDSLSLYISNEENRVEVLSFNVSVVDSILTAGTQDYDSLKPLINNLKEKYRRN